MNEAAPLTVKSADRVLTLFEVLARHGRGMTHTELAEELDIPKSSLSQLVRTLVGRNYLAHVSDNKTYQLGPKFAQLARMASPSHDLVSLAEPLLSDLTRSVGESSALNVQEGACSKVAATVISSHRLVMIMHLNDTAPLHATSGGKAILAWLDQPEIEDYLAGMKGPGVTPNTITRADDLRMQIAQIRAEGFAYAHAEFTDGIAGIAVPVFGAGQAILGSVSVAMPVVRYNPSVKQKVEAALTEVAGIMKQRLA